MKRWNGWGDETIIYPLPPSAAHYIANVIGEGAIIPDASLQSVLASIPESRLPPQATFITDNLDRLLHARGQSLPDWIALRSGHIDPSPDGIAYPASNEDVRSLLQFARQTGTHLIPYGGGTSVVGHINPLSGDVPTLTVDLSRLNRLIHLDETSRLATFEAGVCGPELENQLRQHGYKLGHYPQSFEYSTLGGWVATRSSGQQSYHYGRIEALFAGGQVETLSGPMPLPPLPASAAGPDLRQVILGSEGRLGIITHAIVGVRRLPERESFHAIFFHDWESGTTAMRQMVQAGLPVSMLRLSDSDETETTLILSGRERLVQWADRGLRMLGYGSGRCLMLYGLTEYRGAINFVQDQVTDIARANGGLMVGTAIGNIWRKSRFRSPYLRNTLWEHGYALDTLETALPWTEVLAAATEIKTAIRDGLVEYGERVLVFAHLSHVYTDGASIYVTYLFRRTADPDETLERWRNLKTAASKVIVAHGGTISHQHGVGLDHAPYLAAEKGEVGLALLKSMQQALDPDGLLNLGKLLADN